MNLSTYNVKEFAKLLNVSERTIYRHIKLGQAPSGKVLNPLKKSNKYIFTDNDLDNWKATDIDNKKPIVKTISIDNLLNKIDKLGNDYLIEREKTLRIEVESESLRKQFQQLESDLASANEKYIESESTRKSKQFEIETLKTTQENIKTELNNEIRNLKTTQDSKDIEIEHLKSELNKQKYRTFFQRLFNIQV